jgi:hypothetical protein
LRLASPGRSVRALRRSPKQPDVIARTVRITLRDTSPATPPDHIIDVIVTETINVAADHESAQD